MTWIAVSEARDWVLWDGEEYHRNLGGKVV